MPGEVLMALAQWAGQTVAAAAVTDVWEAARHKVARLLGRGDARKTETAERWLDETHQQLTAAQGADLEPVRAAPRSDGRAGLRICWMRTPEWRRSFAPGGGDPGAAACWGGVRG